MSAEQARLDRALVRDLATARVGAVVEARDWPVAPGERAALSLRRVDVYAPDARVFAVEGASPREMPRSRWAFWTGETLARSVVVAVDPDRQVVMGAWTGGAGGSFSWQPMAGRPDTLRIAGGQEGARAEPIRCDLAEGAGFAPGRRAPRRRIEAPARAAAEAISTVHHAVVAVDTDSEFLFKKFGDNTTAATNYIAALFASLRTIYERDVLVRPLQGTTFLRVGPDPYPTGSSASERLLDFSDYWYDHYLTVPRAAAMMLSGKQAGGGASGVAFVQGLCDKGTPFEGGVYGGFSFNQVTASGSTVATNDLFIAAHELGHVFGSPHTHCETTGMPGEPIDRCYAEEPSQPEEDLVCFSGTEACPAAATYSGIPNVKGTLMSYCHTGTCTPQYTVSSSGGSALTLVFHTRSLDEYVDPHVQDAVNACIFPVSNLETLHFYTLSPCRIVDTRGGAPIAGGALAAGEERVWTLAGQCLLPSAASGVARAVSLNVTITGAAATGSLAFNAGDLAAPVAATAISFSAGETRANNAILPLSITPTEGAVRVRNTAAAAVHVILDVNGYFRP